jgi:hypothetical protein
MGSRQEGRRTARYLPPHAVFRSDYDMLLAEQLVQRIDVCINAPRRPWEEVLPASVPVAENGWTLLQWVC